MILQRKCSERFNFRPREIRQDDGRLSGNSAAAAAAGVDRVVTSNVNKEKRKKKHRFYSNIKENEYNRTKVVLEYLYAEVLCLIKLWIDFLNPF